MTAFSPDSSLVEQVEVSPNQDERTTAIDMIVLHYTGMEWTHEAMARLCDPEARVSSHYVVHENGRVAQLVPEARRAWHAGVSSWEGFTDINSRSIGIEIANPGHDFGYPEFPSRQIAAVTALCRGITRRRSIRSDHVVAHSDVAPSRKQDPGEKFPWKVLAVSGVGLWVEPAPIVEGATLTPGTAREDVRSLQKSLADYGYGVEPSANYDTVTKDVVVAFQRHFRPARVDGLADPSTRETLRRLLDARAKLLAAAVSS